MSASTTTTRQRRPGKVEVRERLLAAAAELFARDGFEATSIEDLSEHAGFSRGAFYSNFRDKDELMLGLIRQWAGEFRTSIGQTGTTAEDVGAVLASHAAVRRGSVARLRFILQLEFWLHAVRHRSTRIRLRAEKRAIRAALADELERQAEVHGVRLTIPAVEVAALAQALSAGLALDEGLDPDGSRPDFAADAFALLFGAVTRSADNRKRVEPHADR